ncbi:MAG: FimV/HubP family polar landmark protein [Rhodoferax sp.]|nr:FimV/HubP family polar landmark protein [Rhodoferax sp.]MDO8447194.1 FimV/HubP family polar landmark protein [Rhodoferax sp.]
MANSHRWQKTAMAAAAAALFGLWASNATALSLGRITVQSALGEPLRAEIDVPDINAEEAASLKAAVAPPDAFRAAGLEYNPAMSGLQATLQRRANGRAYIRLSSDRAINDPFVDMILEASWASGRIVRDYTMLFDPPSLRQAKPAAPTAAQVPAQPPASGAAARAPVAPPPAATQPAEPRTGPTRTPAPPAVARVPSTGTEQVTVKSGDTASKIATATKPANVSLDQMLVALLRANPEAFVDNNVNRVKAGSVMNVPTAEQAGATPAGEASQIIVAQSKDFNEFRRRLATSAPSAQVAAADRKASGTVQAQVEDKKPLTTAPDKLTLSKGALQGKPAEDQLARERSAKDAASRAAEVSRNISELNKLGAASSVVAPSLTASAAAAASGPATVVAAVTTPAQAASAASMAPEQAASAAASTPLTPPAQTVSAPAAPASAAAKRPVVVPAPQPEVGMVDELIENPLVPAGAIGLIALLAGFGFYRARQRKNASQVDSVFLESRLRPDSFFGASGGQSVDTNDSSATGSSMVYSPSQLDAVDDVDPVAEADVYLAYGRDLQAEEILKDALRSNPGRIAIHHKLLEIFAKRRDTKGFEEIATLAFKVTNGEGPDWERVCELGLGIDPANALYQPGGQPNNPDGTPSRPAPLDYASSSVDTGGPVAVQANAFQPSGAMDLDLDLDFALDEEPASVIREATASIAEPAPAAALDLDFGLSTEAMEPFEAPQAAVDTDAIEFSLPDLEVEDNSLTMPSAASEDFTQQAATSFGATRPAPLPSSETEAPPPAPDLTMLEFDLGSLSLDLGDAPEVETAAAAPGAHEDPLGTKLALAEEFRAIGDDDGARALIEEVISEASGDMKIKAQRALSNL